VEVRDSTPFVADEGVVEREKPVEACGKGAQATSP
jgi:hypothetical protein